jgi:4-hydroxybenzoate polyprenyltransferase
MELDHTDIEEINKRFKQQLTVILCLFMILLAVISLIVGQYSFLYGILCFIVLGNMGSILIYCRLKDINQEHVYRTLLQRNVRNNSTKNEHSN